MYAIARSTSGNTALFYSSYKMLSIHCLAQNDTLLLHPELKQGSNPEIDSSISIIFALPNVYSPDLSKRIQICQVLGRWGFVAIAATLKTMVEHQISSSVNQLYGTLESAITQYYLAQRRIQVASALGPESFY